MSFDGDMMLDSLQEDEAARLAADEWFQDIPIKLMVKGVLENDIELALSTFNEASGKIGACVIVLPPALDVPDADPHQVRGDVISIVRVLTMPMVNDDVANGGTGKKLYRIALRVLRLFHKWSPGTTGRMVCDKRAIEPYDAPKGSVGVDCYFRSRAGLNAPSKVQVPVIAGDAAAIQLSCNTPGAAIYYTLDGSLPTPTNGTLYGYVLETESGFLITTEEGGEIQAEPFPILDAEDALLRVAAYHPDMQASDCAMQDFQP